MVIKDERYLSLFFALKRQFPIVGGLTTEEEIGMDITLPEQLGGNLPNTENSPVKMQQPVNLENGRHLETQRQATPLQKPTEVPQTNQPIEIPVPTSQEQLQEPFQGQEVIINSIEIGKSPSGVKFGKIEITKKNGQRILVLAKGEDQVALIKDLENGQKVLMEIVEENGFHFVKGVRAGVH